LDVTGGENEGCEESEEGWFEGIHRCFLKRKKQECELWKMMKVFVDAGKLVEVCFGFNGFVL
jgi:hypothetical protein